MERRSRSEAHFSFKKPRLDVAAREIAHNNRTFLKSMDARLLSKRMSSRKLYAEVAGCIICYALKINFAIRGETCWQALMPAGTLYDSEPRALADWSAHL
jgi:hypothetical protein